MLNLTKKENIKITKSKASKKKRNFLKKVMIKIKNILVKNQMKLLEKIIKDLILKEEKNLKKDKDLKNFHLEDTKGNKI